MENIYLKLSETDRVYINQIYECTEKLLITINDFKCGRDDFNSLITIIKDTSEIMNDISQDVIGSQIKICKNCELPFITKDGRINYCSRKTPGTNKTCRDIGPNKIYHDKSRLDYATKIYRKDYSRHAMLFKRGVLTSEQNNQWRIEAKEKLNKVKTGEIGIVEFKQWIENNKIYNT